MSLNTVPGVPPTKASVSEHREQVLAKLVDAAELSLRAGQPLRAADISEAAGIARNSIYRYVKSVDDLRGLVLARHLPAWEEAIHEAIADCDNPEDRLIAWVRANMRQAKETGHDWLITVSRGGGKSPTTKEFAEFAHRILWAELEHCWAKVINDRAQAARWSRLTLGLLQAGFAMIGREENFPVLEQTMAEAVRALVIQAQNATNEG